MEDTEIIKIRKGICSRCKKYDTDTDSCLPPADDIVLEPCPYIQSRISPESRLVQIAEECVELSIALINYFNKRDNESLGQKDIEEMEHDISEEFTDVCLSAVTADMKILPARVVGKKIRSDTGCSFFPYLVKGLILAANNLAKASCKCYRKISNDNPASGDLASYRRSMGENFKEIFTIAGSIGLSIDNATADMKKHRGIERFLKSMMNDVVVTPLSNADYHVLLTQFAYDMSISDVLSFAGDIQKGEKILVDECLVTGSVNENRFIEAECKEQGEPAEYHYIEVSPEIEQVADEVLRWNRNIVETSILSDRNKEYILNGEID